MHVEGNLIQQLAFESTRSEAAEVGAAKDETARFHEVCREFGEMAEVFFDSENPAFFIAGKCGWIEHNGIEFPALFGKTLKPVKGIAFTEMMVGGIEMVVGKVSFCPIEIGLGKIERGGLGTSECGGYGKRAGVGEGVEQGEAGCHEAADRGAVIALVEEDSLGVTGLK